MGSPTFTYHRKIREIGLGLLLYEIFNNAFDYLFYPIVVALWGFIDGGALAVALSFLANSAVFVAYEHMRIDWLGAHALRELDDAENKSRITKLMTWMGSPKNTLIEKIASPAVFVALTLPIDPLIVAVHFRRTHFQGITVRDWLLLWSATAAANLWWLVKVGAIVEFLRFIYFHFIG